MNITYDHPFMDFAVGESAQLDADAAWSAWVKRAEAVLGHNLDGDDSAPARAAGKIDGYSLDGAYDAFCASVTVDAFVRTVMANPVYRGGTRWIDEEG